MREHVLKQLHDAPTAGHLGVNRTLASTSRFYWFGMKGDIEDYVLKCEIWNSKKPSPKVKCAKLKQYLVGVPLERIAIDICGPWPLSSKGNKYILVVMDYFTKFAEAYPLHSMDAETVGQTLVNEFIMRYGVPLQLHSDRGTNFMSDLFKMCQLLGVEKTQTTSFHPQSDGLVERFNKTLETMLSMFVASNQKDWDQWLPGLPCAYRATPQNSTKQSPNLMMFGRELSLPTDLMIGRPPDGGKMDVSE